MIWIFTQPLNLVFLFINLNITNASQKSKSILKKSSLIQFNFYSFNLIQKRSTCIYSVFIEPKVKYIIIFCFTF